MEELPREDKDFIDQLLGNSYQASVSVSGSVNGGRNLVIKSDESLIKRQAFSKLTSATYKTSPIEIASSLETIFSNYTSKEGHWLFIAQHYTPKTINAVLHQMFRDIRKGIVTVKNPPAYFTTVIQHKPKRKLFRNIEEEKRKEKEAKNETS